MLNFVPGIYIGKAIDDSLVLVLVLEAGKITSPIDPSLPMPYSESGFCSQEEVEKFYKQAACA